MFNILPHRQAIADAFPEIVFDPSWLHGPLFLSSLFLYSDSLSLGNSQHRSQGYWKDNNNIRKFLCKFAAAKGFDPFDADNWKNIKFRDIKNAGVCNKCASS
jgi:hypothetical protein